MKTFPFSKSIIQAKEWLLDLIFPLECLSCGKSQVLLCQSCQRLLNFNDSFICPVCFKNSFQGLTHPSCRLKSKLDGILIAGYWQQVLMQDLIHAFKYEGLTDLKTVLAQILIEKINNSPLFFQILMTDDSVVVPIPLHRRRFLERGYNQAELLAQELSGYIPFKLVSTALIRSKNTKAQTKLSGAKRRHNVAQAFNCLQPSSIKDKTVILIDDVATTFATLESAAQVLKRAGAKSIWGLVLAHG